MYPGGVTGVTAVLPEQTRRGRGGTERHRKLAHHVTAPGSGGAAAPGAMSGGTGNGNGDGNGAESGAERRVRIVVEYW